MKKLLFLVCLFSCSGCSDSKSKSKTQSEGTPPPGQIEYANLVYSTVSFDLSYYPTEKTMERLTDAFVENGFTIFEINRTSIKVAAFAATYENVLKIKPEVGQHKLDLKNIKLGDINAVVFVEIASVSK